MKVSVNDLCYLLKVEEKLKPGPQRVLFKTSDKHHHPFYMAVLPAGSLCIDKFLIFLSFLRSPCAVIVSVANVGDPDHSVFLDPEKGLWKR